MLVEIHMLQNHSPSNPNRDELGAPKTAVFGGCVRARISSQCLKRSIRRSEHFTTPLGEHRGTRTKFFPDLIREELERLEREGETTIPDGERNDVISACCSIAENGKEETKTEKSSKTDARSATAQLIFLGPDHAKEFVNRLKTLRVDMPEAYQYFLNPKARFKGFIEEELEHSGITEKKERDAILKECWSLAKSRYSDLMREDEAAQSEEPIPPVQCDAGGARTIVKRLEELHQSNSERYKQLIFPKKSKKAERNKLSDEERKRLEAEEKEQKDAEKIKKPGGYGDFLASLRSTARHDAVDIALFGRMTTSDAFEDVEAAMEVAHAISVHEVFPQVDYFTAVDDLGKGAAAAHVGENQFNSSLYYKYFSLDWPAFIERLLGPKPKEEDFKDKNVLEEMRQAREAQRLEMTELAARGLAAFLRAAACTVPTGKKKGHANNNLPDGILIEIKKKRIPTNYANAFLKPVQSNPDRDLMEESVRALGHYAGSVVRGFEIDSRRLWYSSTSLPLEYQPTRPDGDKTPPSAIPMAEQVATFSELIRRMLQELGQDPALADEKEGQS